MSQVDTDTHVFGLVGIYKKKAPEQQSLGIKFGFGCQVGRDVNVGGRRRGVRQLLLLLDIGEVTTLSPPLGSSSSSSNVGI